MNMKTSLPIKHVPKGWGWEKWIVNCEEYCGKLLFFNKGKRCSWHYHVEKDEVFYLQSGKMIVYYSNGDDITKGKQLITVVLDIKCMLLKTLSYLSFPLSILIVTVIEL